MRIGPAVPRASLLVCFVAVTFLPAFCQTVTVTPTTLSFPNQVQGTPGVIQKVTLKNGQTSAITVTNVSSNLSDYSQTNTCPVSPSTLAAGRTCIISVTFTPAALGSRTGTLTVTDTGASSPQTVSLSGTGIAAVTASPTSLSFGNQPIGLKSAASAVTVTNNQSKTLTITKISTNLSDYTTSTTCPKILAAKSSCSISVFFTPTVAGTRSATLTVADNASVSPTVSLTGTGIVPAVVSPSTLTFASQALGTTSASQSVTLTNNQSTTLSITSITSSLSDFSFTSTCPISPSTLAAGASCSASITFSPKATGSRSGTLSFKDNANNSPQTVSLSGTGTAATLVSISITPSSSSIVLGKTQQFTATGTYTDSTTQNLTSSAVWSSSASTVASVNTGGLATSLSQGTTNVSAASGSINSSTSLTVTAPTLVSLAITPVNPSIPAGTSQQFKATGTYTDGSTQDVTSSVSWSSSAPAIVSISSTALATGGSVGTATVTAASASITGSTTVTVTQPTLVSLVITPANSSFALGTTQALKATGTYTDGSTLDLTNSVTWSTTNSGVATVSSQGVLSSVGLGSTSVTATSGSISGSTTLTVTPAVLVSIAVTPAIPAIPLGTTQPFTATGTYSDGSTQNITGTSQWSSDTTAVATITNDSASQGLASSLGQGTTTIKATSGSVTGSTTLTVTTAVLVSLAITPANPSIALGTTQPFTVTGTFTDGSAQDLTSTATWSSDTVSTATINNAGLAQSTGIGTATVTASSGTISNSTLLTVTAATLVSIAINPPVATVALGSPQQFTATGTFTDGTTQDLTASGHWSSTAASVATISNTVGTAGLASTLTTGTTTIGISSGSVSAQATLVVNAAALVSIALSPQNSSIPLGTSQPFTATGTYTDGSTQDLTSVVTWSSSDALVAIISNSLGSYGLATSSGLGTATISASSNSISNSTSITVVSPALVSIAITPAGASIPLGTSQLFSAMGTYSDGSTQDVTASVAWTSSFPAVAPVTAAGLVTANMLGSTSIIASFGTVTSSADVAVTAPILVSVSISPESGSIAKGTSQQFTATGTYSDGSLRDLTSAVNWSSSSIAVATIGGTGLATGAGIGTATITASVGSITVSATLDVGQPILVSLAVTPANPSFALGTTLPLTATGTYSDGSTLDLTATVAWSTADPSTATFNNQGVASSVGLGSTSVTATSGSITGSTTLTVTPAVLISIAVTPAIPSIPLGTTQPFTATGTYSDGSTQNITGTSQWSSDDSAVASISNDSASHGIASSLGQGSATITATSGSVTGSTTLTVTTAVLVSLAITPSNPSIALGTTQPFTVTGTFTDGSAQDLTSTATWSSDTVSTATINNAGLAQSTGIGTATVTATSGTISNSTLLTVTAATLVSMAIDPPVATVPLGSPQQFTATGTFTDGTTQDLTASGHWSSTAASVATISNTAGTAGQASTLTTGTTTIGISSGSVSAQATLAVNAAALVSISLSPLNPNIPLGTSQPFTATGTYTDGSTQDLTSVVTWSSSDALVAIISNSLGSYGLATSSGSGTATISASSNSISNSTSVTVGQAAISSLAVTPASISVALGYGIQFSATATYSDGSTKDITQSSTWTSSVPGVAAMNPTGYATSILPGTTTISASSGSISSGAVLTVTAAVPISLAITPASSSIFVAAQQQFTATLYYSDGISLDVTSSVAWSSSNQAVATISGTGLAVGAAGGSVAVGANWGSNLLIATATLTVSPPTVSITPAAASVALSGTQQFSATVTGSGNQSVSWNVDGVTGGNSTIGTISTAGLYTASPLIGSHTITAIAQANSASQGTASLTVGSLVPVLNTFFGMHLHLAASPVPAAMEGTGRMWDSASAQWPNLNTANGTFVWTNLDNVLASYKTAGINDVFYTLWRVPTWASSNPTDTSCDYAASLGSKYYGACDLPTDISADGTGTNLIWRTWVQNIAQHVNSTTYLANHAHIRYWEPCNECYRSPTLDPGYNSGGNVQVAYKGTYAQLVRLMQDARCVIVGNPNDPITALNTTCGQAGYPVTGIDPTAQMVMPSSNPAQIGKNPSYPQVMQNLLYCTCASNSCSASITGCPTGSAGSAAVDIISSHIYTSNYTPEQIPSQMAKVRSYLNATDLAKPFWNGEGGWGQNTTATQVNNGDPDMEASYIARFEVMSWASGIVRSYWYQWDNAAYGTLWSPTSKNGCSTPFTSGYICTPGIAYQQVHDWMLGSTLGSCSVSGATWTCGLTQSNGSQAEIIWDTSQTCSNGTCGSIQYSVPSIYLSYSDLSGAIHSINGTVPVGIKPILLKTQ